jgi:parallel beta-helix repeat protein
MRVVSLVLRFVGVIILVASPSFAATRYVNRASAQCSDSGSGTQSIPYCTIGKAATVAVAGDTVLVSSGTYPEYVKVANSGTSTAPIVIRAADGASVLVSGQSRGFEVSSKSWVTISGFNVSNTSSYGIYLTGSSNITITGNHVTTAGQPVSGLEQAGIKVDGSTDSTIAGNVTDHNSDAGIYVSSGSTRVTVAGNVSSFNARVYVRAAPGIDVRSGGNTIIANICHDNEDTGIQVYAYSSSVPSPNNLIVNNLCYDNGDHGIDISSAGSQRVIGNTVYRNVAAGINVEGPSSGTLVVNNISVDNAINGPRSRGNIRVDSQSTSGTTLDYDEVFLSQSGQVQLIWGSTSYSTLSAFRSATGLEAHGLEAAPLWVAPDSGDFHLTPSSPAIDSANSGASGAQSNDLEGDPRMDVIAVPNTGAGPRTYDDRGCYEYQPVSSTCGNGVRDQGEACDGADLNGATCGQQNCTGGTPTCTSSCTISYATCTGCAVCGNGVRETGEQCDGGALGGATCQTLGFYCSTGSGLSCSANCTYNTGSCVSGRCGDGVITSACGEVCDGTNVGGATCAARGCTGGTPTCNASCSAISYSTCTGCPVCGNGIKETGEQCDGAALGGATCQTLGFYCSTGSGLTCKSDCTYNTGSCITGSCGDGIIAASCGEVCDGSNLGGQSCQTKGFDSGTLACSSNCTSFNTTNCVHCNNNHVCDPGENCNSCPGDCFKSAPVCGNGKCEAANGENCLSCPQDCNGVQTGRKDKRYCCGSGAGTNPVSCSDARCTGGGNSCTTIATPTSCCGDGTCQANENTTTCGVDCGP